MASKRKTRLSAADRARRLAEDDLYLTLWAERKFADENEAIFKDPAPCPDTKITHGGKIPLPQDLTAFYAEDEVEFRKKPPDPKERPFEDLRTALAILITRVVSTKPTSTVPVNSVDTQPSSTPPKSVGAVRLPLSFGYLVQPRSRSRDGYRFEQALAPYYKGESVPETREKIGDPRFPGNSEVFTNMTQRPSYYMWQADIGAIKTNFEDVRELLHGNFWVDLGSHNAKKLRLIREFGKEYENKTGQPFEPAMNVLNDITSLEPAHKELLAAGVAPDKILKLPGDFESEKFWRGISVAYEKAREDAIAAGQKPPELRITSLGGTDGNRGPDGLKRHLKIIRSVIRGAFKYISSIDGTGTDLRPEDIADADSKDLHGKTPHEIKQIEVQGRVAVEAAYGIPETKHFHHMSVYNILHLTRMMDNPCDLTAEIHFHYPHPGDANVSAVEFGATNHGRKKTIVYLPREHREDEPGVKRKSTLPHTSIMEDRFEILSEQLTKMGRSFVKDLFKETGAEVVKRLGYIDDGGYPGVNHGIFAASYPDRSATPQLSPSNQSSAQAYPD